MKKVIFSALIVVAAVGGTLVSNAKSSKLITTAKPFGSSAPCNQTVGCHPSTTSTCIILGVTYGTTNPDTGLCTQTLALDQ